MIKNDFGTAILEVVMFAPLLLLLLLIVVDGAFYFLDRGRLEDAVRVGANTASFSNPIDNQTALAARVGSHIVTMLYAGGGEAALSSYLVTVQPVTLQFDLDSGILGQIEVKEFGFAASSGPAFIPLTKQQLHDEIVSAAKVFPPVRDPISGGFRSNLHGLYLFARASPRGANKEIFQGFIGKPLEVESRMLVLLKSQRELE